jgi:hypothetical protein
VKDASKPSEPYYIQDEVAIDRIRRERAQDANWCTNSCRDFSSAVALLHSSTEDESLADSMIKSFSSMGWSADLDGFLSNVDTDRATMYGIRRDSHILAFCAPELREQIVKALSTATSDDSNLHSFRSRFL